MRWGIYSGHVNTDLPYSMEITASGTQNNVPIALLYAIAWHESIQGEVNGSWTAATVISPDGGHGCMQLTSSWPDDWQDPISNANWACVQYILPAAQFWTNPTYGFNGLVLVKCIAATYNAGIGGALAGHNNGNIDLYTTDSYGARVQEIYEKIVATGRPT